MPEGFRERVVEVIAGLGPGQVVSYGDVAEEAGFPGAARAVGAVLAGIDDGLPWWRVVRADGRLVPGHERKQARLLAAEGVRLTTGSVPRVARR
jgi:methylated-DNA-protein-cysteine methyltransferase related protein